MSTSAPPQNEIRDRRGAAAGIAPYNCTPCYRKKTKCDRLLSGCGNCERTASRCQYPEKDTTPRKRGRYNKDATRKNSELEKKVLALEATINGMQGISSSSSSRTFTQAGHTSSSSPSDALVDINANLESQDRSPRAAEPGPSDASHDPSGHGSSRTWSKTSRSLVDTTSPGSAINDDLDQTDEFDGFLPTLLRNVRQPSLVSTSPEESPPDLTTFVQYLPIFRKKINPLLKVVHVPSFEQMLQNCQVDGSRLPVGADALIYAISYAAIAIDRSRQDHQMDLDNPHEDLKAYSTSIKTIVASSIVLSSKEFFALQALTIYLYLNVSDNDFTRYYLTGTAIRMAQFLGIHKKSTLASLSPFEGEIAKRLWWNLYRLEKRYAENYISFPFAVEPEHDMPLPANVDDSEISPTMRHAPQLVAHRTEMTFSLAGFRLTALTFEVLKMREEMIGPEDRQRQLQKIKDHFDQLANDYVRVCDNRYDLDFMVITYTKLYLCRIWLVLHSPSVQTLENMLNGPAGISTAISEKQTSKFLALVVKTLEYALGLSADRRLEKWSWFWNGSNEIYRHLEFSLLAEICLNNSDPMLINKSTASRVWKVLDREEARRHKFGPFQLTDSPEGPFEIMLNRLRQRVRDIRYADRKAISTPVRSPFTTRQNSSQDLSSFLPVGSAHNSVHDFAALNLNRSRSSIDGLTFASAYSQVSPMDNSVMSGPQSMDFAVNLNAFQSSAFQEPLHLFNNIYDTMPDDGSNLMNPGAFGGINFASQEQQNFAPFLQP